LFCHRVARDSRRSEVRDIEGVHAVRRKRKWREAGGRQVIPFIRGRTTQRMRR
jgi:hypothetical protein